MKYAPCNYKDFGIVIVEDITLYGSREKSKPSMKNDKNRVK